MKRSPWAKLFPFIAAIAAAVLVGIAMLVGRLAWSPWLVASISAILGIATAIGAKLLEQVGDYLAIPLRKLQRKAVTRSALLGFDRTVSQVNGRMELNIHPALPLPNGSGTPLSDEFPEYVPRDIDADLRTWIRGHLEVCGLVVLVGGAAAGKTRCLYEALRDEVPHWRMLQPGSGKQLTEIVEAGIDLTHSVVWLDELQNYFANEPMRASTVNFLLAGGRGPVIIAGTIRTEELEGLLTEPSDRAPREFQTDSHRVLGMVARWSGLGSHERAVRFELSSAFSDDEFRRAEALGVLDPRLQVAVRDAYQRNVTPTLAGAPELIGRWLGDGDRPGQAIIEAGVVARRCGHPEPIPAGLLEQLALVRLSDDGAAPGSDDWLALATSWAKTPVKGRIAAIVEVRTAVKRLDGYRVSDILVHHSLDKGDRLRRTWGDPRIWQILLSGATAQIRAAIGTSAFRLGQHEVAEGAWLSAAAGGDIGAMRRLARYRREKSERQEARFWLERAVRADDPYAKTDLGHLAAEDGDADEAERWFREGAESGDEYTMQGLGFFLASRGNVSEALHWYKKAADLGEPNAMTNVGWWLERQGELAEAELWNRRAAELGHLGAMENLGNILRRRGERLGALQWYRRGAQRALEAIDDESSARPWPGEASDQGQSNVILELANVLAEDGLTDEAEAWYRRGAKLGDARAAAEVARLLRSQGWNGDADSWIGRAAELSYANLRAHAWSLRVAFGDAGLLNHASIMYDHAHRLVEQGLLPDARLWLERAAEYGEERAKVQLSRLSE